MKKFIQHEGRLSLAIPLLGTIGGEEPETYRKPKALVLVGMETDGRMAMSEAGKRHAQKIRDAQAAALLPIEDEGEPSQEDEPAEDVKQQIRESIEAAKQKRAAHEKSRERRRRRKDRPASDDDE